MSRNVSQEDVAGDSTGRAPLQRAVSTVALVLLVALFIATSLRTIWTVDYWWLYKTGEQVWTHGIPRVDSFSWTVAGQQRVELRWLFCTALYLIANSFGHSAVVVVKTALLGWTFLIACTTGPRRSHRAPVWTAIVASLAIVASSPRFFERPELVNYLFLAAYVWILDRALRAPTRWVWAIPPLQIVWTNCHPSFPLGVALVAIWLVHEALTLWWPRRGSGAEGSTGLGRLAIPGSVLIATLLACVVNPWAFESLQAAAVSFSLFHGTSQKAQITELWSTFDVARAGGDFLAVKCFFVLAAVVLLFAALNVRRLRPFWVLLVGAMLYLAIVSVRNIPLFAIVAIPFTLINSGEWAERRSPGAARLPPSLRMFVALGFIAIATAGVRSFVTGEFDAPRYDTIRFGAGLSAHRFPIRATEFYRATGSPGPILNDMGSGAYLLAQDVKVFLDPRGELYLDKIAIQFDELTKEPTKFSQLEVEYGFRSVLLSTQYVGLIEHLSKQRRWRLVYLDEVAAVFFRDDVAPAVPRLDIVASGSSWYGELVQRLPSPTPWESRGWWTPMTAPTPYLRTAWVCFALGQFRCAQSLLTQSYQAHPPSFDAWFALGFSASRSGDWAAAAPAFVEAVRRTPTDRQSRLRGAVAWVNLGRPREGLDLALPLLEGSSADDELLGVLGSTALAMKDGERATEWLGRAVTLRPDLGAYRVNLARAMFLTHQFEAGLEQAEHAWRLSSHDPALAADAAAVASRLGRAELATLWGERAASSR